MASRLHTLLPTRTCVVKPSVRTLSKTTVSPSYGLLSPSSSSSSSSLDHIIAPNTSSPKSLESPTDPVGLVNRLPMVRKRGVNPDAFIFNFRTPLKQQNLLIRQPYNEGPRAPYKLKSHEILIELRNELYRQKTFKAIESPPLALIELLRKSRPLHAQVPVAAIHKMLVQYAAQCESTEPQDLAASKRHAKLLHQLALDLTDEGFDLELGTHVWPLLVRIYRKAGDFEAIATVAKEARERSSSGFVSAQLKQELLLTLKSFAGPDLIKYLTSSSSSDTSIDLVSYLLPFRTLTVPFVATPDIAPFHFNHPSTTTTTTTTSFSSSSDASSSTNPTPFLSIYLTHFLSQLLAASSSTTVLGRPMIPKVVVDAFEKDEARWIKDDVVLSAAFEEEQGNGVEGWEGKTFGEVWKALDKA